MLTRRDFVAAAALAPALARLQPPSSEARMIGTVPLHLPGRPVAPLERLIASGLDARLATDLSDLGNSSSAIDNQSAIRNPQSALVTPNDRYYIRTSAPVGLEAAAAATPRTIAMRGRPGDTDATAALTIADPDRLPVNT